MRGKATAIVLMIPLSVAALWTTFMKPLITVASSSMHVASISLSPTVFPPTSAQSTSSQQTNGLQPVVIAALIGLLGAIIVAVITGAFAFYQSRKAARIEQQRRAEEQQYEQQRLAEKQQYEERLLFLQKEVERQFRERERVEQQEAIKSEALRLKMLQAQTNSERAVTYRQALYEDPRISRLQILDMNQPLMLANIYVRVRVHQETRVSYEIDPVMRAAEIKHDPNALLQASLKYLEHRISSALDPSEAIRTYKHCIILGDPGAGKTTLLKYLTLQAAASKLDKLPDLPILVELNAFASSGHYDLLDFVSANWDERYGFPKDDARSFIVEKLYEGNAFLLLDALDETAIGNSAIEAEASYQRVVDSIIKTATRYYQSPIVVTARKAGYQQRAPLQGFTELEVLDFRPDDIHQFVINWFEGSQNAQRHIYSTDLNTKLEQNPRMLALAANPLLLSIILLVYEAQLDLPDRRAELYKRCVDTLLTEWDAKRNIRRRREFKPEHKRQLLAEIAWHFHLQGRRYFPEGDLLSLIASFLPKINLLPEQNEQILTEIANEQGLLKEQAKGWQGFLHLTLQEYFVALYIAEHQQLEALVSHCGDPWWEEVLLLYAGYTSDASSLLRELLGNQDGQLQEDLFQTNLVLAGRCLAARPTIRDVSLREAAIEQMFKVLTTTPYSLIQEHIAAALTAIGSLEVSKRLQQLLLEPQLNETVRESIAEGLGRSAENFVNLEQLLFNAQLDLNILQRAAEGLGKNSNRHIVLRSLSNPEIKTVIRQTIARSLGRVGEHTTVQLLSNLSLGATIRSSIAEGLGDSGERMIAPELLQLLSNTQIDMIVRGSIALALGHLGERSIVPDLMKLLANPRVEAFVRIRIADSLGYLGEATIVSDLIVLFSSAANVLVRTHIALSLVRLGERSIIPQLLQLLSDPQIGRDKRKDIAKSIDYLKELTNISEQDLSPVTMQIEDIHTYLAQVLSGLEEQIAIPELLQFLFNLQIDRDVRIRIVEALGRVASDEATAQSLMAIFPTSDIADHIHRALWTICRRAGIRILIASEGKIQIAKW